MSDPSAASTGGVPGRLELSAPADPEMLDLVHAVLGQLWTNHPDVSDADRFRFETAVVEILGNILEHAYRLESDAGESDAGESASGSDSGESDVAADAGARRFDISLSATDSELVALFGDNGVPVALDLSDVTMPDHFAESGRGLALAAAAVDELSYERIEGRNHWRLLCIRQSD